MVSKLPHWAWSGAWLLAYVAGFVNIIGILGFESQALSHLTGSTSFLAAAFAERDVDNILRISAVIGSFVAGSIISGMIIQNSLFEFRRRYALALVIQCVLLCISVPLFVRHIDFGVNLVACSCGLQNSMATTYSGAAVRTTHLTGILTDLGTLIGQGLRGLPMDFRRLSLYVTIITAFLCGGVSGTIGFREMSYHALYCPAALTALMAVYSVFRALQEKRERQQQTESAPIVPGSGAPSPE